MKKILPFLALLCLFSTVSKTQIIFSEDFETDFETNSWLTVPVWQIGTSSTLSSQYFNIPAHTQFAGVNDDGPGAGVPSFGSIITPEIDLSGIPAALLSFECYFINGDYDADETARVLISIDSMTSWTVLLDIGGGDAWQSFVLPLGEGISGQKIHLAFEYDDNGGWNYGFCVDDVKVEIAPDYFAITKITSQPEYTVTTPRQIAEPLRFVHQFENYGAQALNDISFRLEISMAGQGTVLQDSHFVAAIPPGSLVLDTVTFLPEALGKYTFQFFASHPELGNNFYSNTQVSAFELSDSVMARDDGERDGSIGMSFGDPSWYGYYGSEFDLTTADTLTGVSVWMSATSSGSFNLKVNVKDSTGLPTIELFHSNPTEIAAGFNGWVWFPLPNEMPLAAGNYVFAVGQDTIQGVMGHGFDFDRTNPTYWIVSPVAGGGYPWFNAVNGQTLMIRPHFKLPPFVNAVHETALAALKAYPNPANNYLFFDFENPSGEALLLTLTDAAGRVVIAEKTSAKELKVSHLPPGLYFLKLQNDERMGVTKFLKK